MLLNGCGKRLSFILIVAFTLAGCGERLDLAPVVESHWRNRHYSSYYTVVRGDTLYSIAFRYDMDYRQLAAFNHISSPYTVKIGQRLFLHPQIRRRTPGRRRFVQRSYSSSRYTPSHVYGRGRWQWPVRGRLVQTFIPDQGHKGINIAGHNGQKIVAAANGVVAYAGSGLAGYGNLIIIKHANQFLTAYGNNARNLVHEGQTIRAGQVIAEMGVVDHRYFGVHFEIRHAGRPVNPLQYL